MYPRLVLTLWSTCLPLSRAGITLALLGVDKQREWKECEAQHRRPHCVQTSDTQQLLFRISAFSNYRVHAASIQPDEPQKVSTSCKETQV